MAIVAVAFIFSFTVMSNEICAMIYNVRDYGAKGDGVTLDSPSINEAIEAAAAAGGGEVYLPAGTYLSGSIRLKSNIHLNLSAGCHPFKLHLQLFKRPGI